MIAELAGMAFLGALCAYALWGLQRQDFEHFKDTSRREVAFDAERKAWDEERRRYVSALLLKDHSEPAAASVVRGPQAGAGPTRSSSEPPIFQEGI